MNKIMKIGKGVDTEGHEIPGYVRNCATSLSRLLEEGDVTIKAMGNRAIVNTMKAITRTAKLKESDGHKMIIDVPTFVTENVGESELAVFTIDVSVK